ncbi:MAG: hypothetical protein RSB41_03575 [Bacilli bacterium]
MNIKEIEKKIIDKEYVSDNEINLFLHYIVNEVDNIISKDTYEFSCDLVQGLIGRYLNNLGVISHPCITTSAIGPSVVGHSFIVASINNKLYLIDPSYRQFYFLDKTYEELYIKRLRIKSFSPYHYALELNKDIIEDFLSNGFMPLNADTAYVYGNSFVKTTTNVLDDYPFTNVNGEVFINSFLKGNELLRKYDYNEIEVLNKDNDLKI